MNRSSLLNTLLGEGFQLKTENIWSRSNYIVVLQGYVSSSGHKGHIMQNLGPRMNLWYQAPLTQANPAIPQISLETSLSHENPSGTSAWCAVSVPARSLVVVSHLTFVQVSSLANGRPVLIFICWYMGLWCSLAGSHGASSCGRRAWLPLSDSQDDAMPSPVAALTQLLLACLQ